jgi:hypothetical protein
MDAKDPKKFVNDLTKRGWRLLEDAPIIADKCEIVDIEIVSGEESINILLGISPPEAGSNFGQHDSEWFLANSEKIPHEWDDYFIVFPGTVWESVAGTTFCPFLYHLGNYWHIDFHPISTLAINRFVILRKRISQEVFKCNQRGV